MHIVREWMKDNLDLANQQQSQQYNLRRCARRFRVGDLVWRRQHVLSSAAHNIAAKLAPKFQSPLRVSRILSPLVYEP